jgi:hypothetical protein
MLLMSHGVVTLKILHTSGNAQESSSIIWVWHNNQKRKVCGILLSALPASRYMAAD